MVLKFQWHVSKPLRHNQRNRNPMCTDDKDLDSIETDDYYIFIEKVHWETFNGRHKAILVARGLLTNIPRHTFYSCFWIVLHLAELIHINTTDSYIVHCRCISLGVYIYNVINCRPSRAIIMQSTIVNIISSYVVPDSIIDLQNILMTRFPPFQGWVR